MVSVEEFGVGKVDVKSTGSSTDLTRHSPDEHWPHYVLHPWALTPLGAPAWALTPLGAPPWWPLTPLGAAPRTLTPDSWDAYESDGFSKPRLLHLPMHRKALNSLTWDTWFSLINNNLLMFRLPAPSYKRLYSLTPPTAPLRTIFSGSLEILSPGPES